MSLDPWHYPRTEFTHDTFVSLTRGPIASMSLFGPRRTGKTEFLLKDLGALAADTYGHRVLYASFWQTGADPLAMMLYACDTALRPRSYAERVGAWLGNLPVKVKLGALKGMAELEIDLSRKESPRPADDLLLLDSYLDRLGNARKPAILMFDEFQEIAGHGQAEQVMAGLRTSLDTRKTGVRTIFTGSSQVALNKVFNGRNAPFYRFAHPLHLPDLDAGFVAHQLKVFHQVYRRKIDPARAAAVFDRFDRNPLFLQRWLMTLGTDRTLDEDTAVARTFADLAAELDYDRTWRRLEPYHRAMARLLAERVDDPMGEAGAERYAALLGTEAPIPQTRQSYLRTLERRGIADQWDKEWRIADPIFEAWILDRGTDAF